MAHGFTESPDGLRYQEHISLPLRLFVGLIGLSMFVIPLPFVLHAHLGLPWWQLLLVALCVVVPCLVGPLFLALALCRCFRVQFDTPRQRLLRTSRWPLGRRRVSLDYTRLEQPDVLECPSEDGPYFVVRLAVRGERPMHLGSFDQQTQAEHWRSRIARQLQQG